MLCVAAFGVCCLWVFAVCWVGVNSVEHVITHYCLLVWFVVGFLGYCSFCCFAGGVWFLFVFVVVYFEFLLGIGGCLCVMWCDFVWFLGFFGW